MPDPATTSDLLTNLPNISAGWWAAGATILISVLGLITKAVRAFWAWVKPWGEKVLSSHVALLEHLREHNVTMIEKTTQIHAGTTALLNNMNSIDQLRTSHESLQKKTDSIHAMVVNHDEILETVSEQVGVIHGHVAKAVEMAKGGQ